MFQARFRILVAGLRGIWDQSIEEHFLLRVALHSQINCDTVLEHAVH